MSKSKKHKQKKNKHKLKTNEQSVAFAPPSSATSAAEDAAHQLFSDMPNHLNESNKSDEPSKPNAIKQPSAYSVAAYETPPESSGVRARLGKLGNLLTKTLPKTTKTFRGVDLHQDEFEMDEFHRQSSAAIKLLFGTKAAGVQTLASRFISSERLQSWNDKAFQAVANWANQWAIKDLSKDSRFAKLQTLSELERVNFAKDIANQNRAMATLGGVAALAGVRGVLFDGVWLLLISLRTVYQLAIIFEQQLTGSEGIKKAYGVLSGARLDRLQEKQIVLTALALAKHIFTQEQGIAHGLKAVGVQYQSAQMYTTALSELSERLHVDQWRFRWLDKCLPAVSVAAGSYYNADLIDEVIGTAMATFYPQATQILVHKTVNVTDAHTTKTSNAAESDTTPQKSNGATKATHGEQSGEKARQAMDFGNLAEDT